MIESLALAETLAEQAAERWPADELSFDWQQTVLAYGMHRLYTKSGDERWRDYYRTWLDTALVERWDDPDDPVVFRSSDGLSPAVLAAAAMAEDPSADYQPILDSADAYLATVPRTERGAIVHWGPEHLLGGNPEVWIDSLFMVGVYLLQQYDRTGDEAYLVEWALQYRLFSDHCRDADAQLYRHAWDEGAGENIPLEATFWARGNSWVLVSAGEAVRLAGRDHVQLSVARGLLVEHAEALRALQQEGAWNTVLSSPSDDERNYSETSATALLGYGLLGAGHDPDWSGPGDDRYAGNVAAAVRAIEARLVEGEDGLELHGTSLPTNPGDYDYYVGIGQLDNQMTGVGASIMFLAEADGLMVKED